MSDDSGTTYPAVRLPTVPLGGKRRSASQVFRRCYRIAFEKWEVTPAQLRYWREFIMFVSVEEFAALLRVTGRTIRCWEAGKSRIPFAVWWVMYVTSFEPDFKIARGGFDLFHVAVRGGEHRLVHEEWPDISWTLEELLNLTARSSRAATLEWDLAKAEEEIGRLQAENTALRHLFKTGGVVNELDDMQKRIASLLDRISTADVIDFPDASRERAA